MGTEVFRTAGTDGQQEGFMVTTYAGNDTFQYHLTVVDEDTVRLDERYKLSDGGKERVENKATDSVRDAMADYGFNTVETA